MVEEVQFDQLQHALEIMTEVDKLRKSKQHCSVIIKVGSKKIHAHRSILCANSEYFSAVLSQDTVENQSGIAELNDLDPDCVDICTDFMYGKKVRISREKWTAFMECVTKLQLTKLLLFFKKYLTSALSAETFYEIWEIGKKYHCSDLQETCNEFACQNFDLISRYDEFLELNMEELSVMLTSNQNLTSQTEKTEAILKWVKFSAESRKPLLFQLLKVLELSQIPVHYARFLLETDELVSQSLECVRLLSLSVLDALDISPSSTAVEGFNSILVFDGRSHRLQCFNIEKNTWTEMVDLHPLMEKVSFSAVSLHNHVFVLMSNKKMLRLKYTEPSASWEEMPDMFGEHDSEPRAVADSRYIYVVGDSGLFVERYDTIFNRWEKIAESRAAYGSSCVLLGRKIYCIGGCREGEEIADVEVFHLDSKEWNSVAPVPEELKFSGTTVYLGKVYAVGGENRKIELSPRVWCYDLHKDIWTSMPQLLVERSVLPVITIRDSMFAIGHYCKDSQVIQIYNMKEKTWKQVQSQKLKVLWCTGANVHL